MGTSRVTTLAAVFSIAISLAGPVLAHDATPSAHGGGSGVETLTGSVTIQDAGFVGWATEPMVVLSDLTAAVKHDVDMPLPSTTQQLVTGLEGDASAGATFALPLPIRPLGTMNDVSQGQGNGPGVQLYTLAWAYNQFGAPFLGQNSEWPGWPWGAASIRTAAGSHEIEGGSIVVWAPDDSQWFPTGFGPDGRLFTADDPVGPVAAGWTVIDLDAAPFAHRRAAEEAVPIFEGIYAPRDYADRSYTEAYDAMLDQLRTRFLYTELKQLDWDAIDAEVRPMVEQAEQDHDTLGFTIALNRLSILVNDHEIGGDFPWDGYYADQWAGTIGFHVWQTDDGAIVVDKIFEDQPAAAAGIEPGAEILTWNGEPAADAIAAMPRAWGESSPQSRLAQQLHYAARMPVGSQVELTFRNPGTATEEQVTLTAAEDPDGFSNEETFCIRNGGRWCGGPETTVSIKLLPSGIGYIRVPGFGDEPVGMSHAWNMALQTLKDWGATALIVDVMSNGGGNTTMPGYFAGSFTTESYPVLNWISADDEGQVHDEGTWVVEPSPVQWDLPVAVLVDEYCASACDMFAAAMQHDPEHLIVGMSPTAGALASSYNVWQLPDGLTYNIPETYAQGLDGQPFIEGTGIAPNVRVPVTVETLLATDDPVLAAAEAALLEIIDAEQAAAATPVTAPDGTPVS